MRGLLALVSFGLVLLGTTTVHARTWKSAVGEYSLQADAIAFNETTVILKKGSGDLVAVELAELCEDDREYVKSKEFGEAISESLSELQTWTSEDGLKIRGRVLAFGRKDLSVYRQRGKVIVNGTPFAKIDPLQQQVVLKALSELEGQTLSNEAQLTAWAKGLGGEAKVTPLEGVLMELESGDRIAVPFFLFDSKDRKALQPGWRAWLDAEKDEQMQQRESLMMQSEAMQYQRNQQQYQQVELLKLNMLAVATGITSIWEVGLQANAGVYSRPTSVVVSARDSQTASQMAMQQYPGFQLAYVRRVSR